MIQRVHYHVLKQIRNFGELQSFISDSVFSCYEKADASVFTECSPYFESSIFKLSFARI